MYRAFNSTARGDEGGYRYFAAVISFSKARVPGAAAGFRVRSSIRVATIKQVRGLTRNDNDWVCGWLHASRHQWLSTASSSVSAAVPIPAPSSTSLGLVAVPSPGYAGTPGLPPPATALGPTCAIQNHAVSGSPASKRHGSFAGPFPTSNVRHAIRLIFRVLSIRSKRLPGGLSCSRDAQATARHAMIQHTLTCQSSPQNNGTTIRSPRSRPASFTIRRAASVHEPQSSPGTFCLAAACR